MFKWNQIFNNPVKENFILVIVNSMRENESFTRVKRNVKDSVHSITKVKLAMRLETSATKDIGRMIFLMDMESITTHLAMSIKGNLRMESIMVKELMNSKMVAFMLEPGLNIEWKGKACTLIKIQRSGKEFLLMALLSQTNSENSNLRRLSRRRRQK